MRALTLVLAAVLSACQPSGAQFRTTSVMEDGTYPMPVVLGDQTGLVAGIEPALAVGFVDVPSVQPDPDDPNAVVVSWGTGACDDDTGIGLQRTADGFQMRIAVNTGFDLGCTAQLLVRAVRIRFSEAVPADAIEVSGGL